jgi:hypothetical protein
MILAPKRAGLFLSLLIFQSLPGAPIALPGTPGTTPSMPFSFVENRGQAESRIRFIGNGPGFKAWFDDGGVSLQQGDAFTSIHFEGAGRDPRITATDPLGATANYLRGSNPEHWQRNLPLFGEIHYAGIWDGIEIRFRAEESRTKAEYIVGPGASVDEIRLRFEGTPRIEADGALVVTGATGEFREERPVVFQQFGTEKREVAGSFRHREDGSIGFSVGEYDHSRPLVVDPVLLFSGYFGGTSQSNITGIAVNSYYNIIVAGWTVGTDLPATGGAKPRNSGGVDAFVAGFRPSGGSLLFCTYLGGSSDDRAFGIALDPTNNIYVTGQTSSANFPVLGALQSRLKGARDAFVTKLNATGSSLIYSTFLGGAGADVGNAITVDSSGAAYILGDTTSSDLNVTTGALQRTSGGGQDVFVAKLSSSGSSLALLSYYGGSASDHGASIKVASNGGIYISGSTYSADLPVLLGFQLHSGGGQDGFVARMTPDGSALVFGTYIGGSGGTPGAQESVNAISLGVDGILMVAGTTGSTDFPVTPPVLQAVFGGGQTDGFIARLDPATGALMRCTYFGGSGDDGITAMVTDYYSYFQYIAGYTSSTDFPTANALQTRNAGGLDAFVAKIGFSGVTYSTYLGGVGNDAANALAVDSLTNVVVAGSTSSGAFPSQIYAGSGLGKFQPASVSSFLTKIYPGSTLAVASMPSIFFDVWHNTGYNGANVTLNQATFGVAGDIPLMGDWDGQGTKRLGLFRGGTWILDTNGNGMLDAGDRTIAFGQAGDVPLLGDWNGTGRIKLGLFRQGTFILDLSGHLSGVTTGLNDGTFTFGQAGDTPIAADWNNTGTTKVGVFRAGQWLLDFSGTNSVTATYQYGQAGDIPVVGDWKGTGTANQIGVYRNGFWILNIPTNKRLTGSEQYQMYLTFGGGSYTPLVY